MKHDGAKGSARHARRRTRALMGCLLGLPAVLVLDAWLPLGVAAGVLYLGVVLSALHSRSRNVVLGAAVASSVLTVVGMDVSAPLGVAWQVLVNRSLALAVIWAVALVGLMRNDSESKLERSEESLKAVLDTAPDGIVTTDERGTVTSVNDAFARLFDDVRDELVGKNLTALMPDCEHDVPGTREGEGVRKDGTSFDVSYATGETALPDGTRWLTAVVRDVSQRKRNERALVVQRRQLEAANRELEGFTYSVSHDLRAPLRAIDGFARILLEDHAAHLDAEGARVLGIVRKNVDRMAQLIDDLLAFSRLGQKQIVPSRVDMAELARSVLGEVTAAERDREIEVAVGDLPEAFGDPGLLRQVWINLCDNAVKYTRGKSPAAIEVSGRTVDGEIVYSTKDNGAGFEMEYADKLFGVFQRLHKESEFEGTGVGLALVQRIVARHGGRVWGEGRPGEGATFHFALPAKGE